MGLYIQFQRRAIEGLQNESEAIAPPFIDGTYQLQTPEGDHLYYAGVSEGIGTCSDVHGMDVLVLSQLPTGQVCDLGRFTCAYTVLIRGLAPEEAAADSLATQGIARKCIELLGLVPAEAEGIVSFAPTGKKIIYTAVI